jgi:hypothetical protein
MAAAMTPLISHPGRPVNAGKDLASAFSRDLCELV